MPITISGDGGIAGVTNLDGGDFECATLVASGDTTLGPQAVGRASLFVDDSANSVGINTTTPAAAVFLEVADGTDPIVSLNNTGNGEVRLGCTATAGYIGTESNHPFNIEANSATALTVLANGNIGIGATSPAGALDVGAVSGAVTAGDLTVTTGSTTAKVTIGRLSSTGSDNTSLRIRDRVDRDVLTVDPSNFIYSQASGERVRIDSGGRLLVGTSSVTSIPATLNVIGGNNTVLHTQNANADSPFLFLSHARGTGAETVNAQDGVGAVAFVGYDGTNALTAARIEALVDGTPGTNDMPGRLVFSTTADGASSPTERMRITSNGQMRLAGAGITFNGDTATTNELDDYEEGTWTPTIRENGSGTAWDTINTNNGYYTKIGDCVTFSATFNYSDVATNVNAGFYGWLAGFPFAPNSSKMAGQFFISFLYAGVRTNLYSGVFIGGNAYAGIYKNQDSITPGTMMTMEYPTGAHTVQFQGHYYV